MYMNSGVCSYVAEQTKVNEKKKDYFERDVVFAFCINSGGGDGQLFIHFLSRNHGRM